MPGLLIKNLPSALHRKLKESAARHHRSMTREALALLEQALFGPSRNAAATFPEPLKPLRPLPPDAVVSWIREGRERQEAPNLGKLGKPRAGETP